MNLIPRTMLRTGTAVLILTAAGAVAGCSAQESAGPTAAPSSDSEAAALLPQDVKDRGYITVATDLSYAPFGMVGEDGSTPTGIDIDTAAALEEVLGVEVRIESVSFDAFLPGLETGRFDAGFNAITDTPERREVVDFLDINQYGGLFLTEPDSEIEITEPLSACGLTVGAEQGSDTIAFLEGLSGECTGDGEEAIVTSPYGSLADALVALSSGRVDAVIGGSTAGYNAENSGGAYEVNGPVLANLDGSIPTGGVALPKDSASADALLAAFTQMYDDGTLADIYASYGVNADMLIEPVINGG